MLVRVAPEERRMHVADLPARMRECNRIHAVDFDQIDLGAAQAHDNRHGHHARTVNGEHVAIGKTTAVGSIQPNIDRASQLRHAHKRARISLVPIEQELVNFKDTAQLPAK